MWLCIHKHTTWNNILHNALFESIWLKLLTFFFCILAPLQFLGKCQQDVSFYFCSRLPARYYLIKPYQQESFTNSVISALHHEWMNRLRGLYTRTTHTLHATVWRETCVCLSVKHRQIAINRKIILCRLYN